MSFNPFLEKSDTVEQYFEDFKSLFIKPYDKNEIDPYTKARILMATAMEFEAVRFSHDLHRRCPDNDIRRALALLRRTEQQQQKTMAALKPIDESILESAVCWEHLTVDLTANLAQLETDKYIRAALDFALIEDFDHLYRFCGLLEMEQGIEGKTLIGGFTEIMPGRPSLSAHRHPYDDIKRFVPGEASNTLSKLNTHLIVAAEQQAMNFYMNCGAFGASELSRRLFAEIAMLEEQHITQYGSLFDANASALSELVLHEYTECYIYYCLYEEEREGYIKKLWLKHLGSELSHLRYACDLLTKYEKTDYTSIVGTGDFPTLLAFERNAARNRDYVRLILKRTAENTAILENYAAVSQLPDSYQFFKYNDLINENVRNTPSHKVIADYIAEFGTDYRFEEKPHPIPELRDRKSDNTTLGRI